MRNLKISNSINLNGCKEFNHLRITNIDDFFEDYACNLDYYAMPFKILSDLEEKIKFENNPENIVLISYKPDGDAMFQFEIIELYDDRRIVNYVYMGTIS